MDLETPTIPAEMSSASADGTDSTDGAASGRVENASINGSIPWLPTWILLVGLSAAAATVALIAFHAAGPGIFLEMICLGMLLLAAAFDSASGRIPNPLSYSAILLGLAVNTLDLVVVRMSPRFHEHWLGAVGPAESVAGFLLFGGIGLAARGISAIGGGDMKLLAAVGAMLGTSRATDALLCGLIVGAAYALANLLSQGAVNNAMRYVARAALSAVYPQVKLPVASHGARVFPLAIPIFFGLLFLGLPPVMRASAWLHAG